MEVESGTSHRRGKVLLNIGFSVLMVLGVCLVLNHIAKNRFVRADLTQAKELSLASATKRVVRSLEDVLVIRAYVSGNIPKAYKSSLDQVRELLDEYRAFGGGNVRLEFEDPSADPASAEFARGLGIQPNQFATIERDRQVLETGFVAVAVFYRDKFEVVNLAAYDPKSWVAMLEYELTRAIVKVTSERTKQVGLIANTTPAADPMADPDPHFSGLRELLLKERQVVSVNVKSGNPVPDGVDTLVIVRPKNLTDREKYEIDQFIMRGGNAIFLVDRYGAAPQTGFKAEEIDSNVTDLLEHYGLGIGAGLVKDVACNNVTVSRPYGRLGNVPLTRRFQIPYAYSLRVGEDRLDRVTPMTSSMESVSFLWASPLQLSEEKLRGMKVLKLARSSDESWVEEAPESLAPDENQTEVEVPRKVEPASQVLAAAAMGRFDSFFKGKKKPLTEAEKKKEEAERRMKLDEEGSAAEGDESTPNGSVDGESPQAGDEESSPEDAGNEDGTSEEETSEKGTNEKETGEKEMGEKGTSEKGTPGEGMYEKNIIERSPEVRMLVIGDADFISDTNLSNPTGMLFLLNAVDWFTIGSDLIEIRTRGVVDRNLKDVPDSTRLWIKLGVIGGVPLVVIIFGVFRFLLRGRRRARWHSDLPLAEGTN